MKDSSGKILSKWRRRWKWWRTKGKPMKKKLQRKRENKKSTRRRRKKTNKSKYRLKLQKTICLEVQEWSTQSKKNNRERKKLQKRSLKSLRLNPKIKSWSRKRIMTMMMKMILCDIMIKDRVKISIKQKIKIITWINGWFTR